MSGPIRGRIFIDGAPCGSTPEEWSEPRHKKITTTPAAEETEAERRARVKREKQQERELMQMRSEARARARAAVAPPRRPLSPAVKAHLMASLMRPDPEILEMTMARYRALRAGEIQPTGSVRRVVRAGEEFSYDGPTPGSWMQPLDDEARALVTEAERRSRWRGLPHRLGGGSPVQRGQHVVASQSEEARPT